MQYRVGYSVYRGNDLENEEYVEDEVRVLRSAGIEVMGWSHDFGESRGSLKVSDEEHVLRVLRHYEKGDLYFRLTSVRIIVEPGDDHRDINAAVARLADRIKLPVKMGTPPL